MTWRTSPDGPLVLIFTTAASEALVAAFLGAFSAAPSAGFLVAAFAILLPFSSYLVVLPLPAAH
jgi:hypothetical protein